VASSFVFLPALGFLKCFSTCAALWWVLWVFSCFHQVRCLLSADEHVRRLNPGWPIIIPRWGCTGNEYFKKTKKVGAVGLCLSSAPRHYLHESIRWFPAATTCIHTCMQSSAFTVSTWWVPARRKIISHCIAKWLSILCHPYEFTYLRLVLWLHC